MIKETKRSKADWVWIGERKKSLDLSPLEWADFAWSR
jgi:hypothetical protein